MNKNFTKKWGFTLIELLTCLSILVILMTLSFSYIYQEYQQTLKRVEVINTLLEIYLLENSYFIKHHTYTNNLNKLSKNHMSFINEYYIKITTNTEENEFTLTAEHHQNKQKPCHQFSIDSKGTKTPTACWNIL